MIKFKVVFSFFFLLISYLPTHAQGFNQLVQNLESMRFVMYSNGIDPVGDAVGDDYYQQEWEVANITFEANDTRKYDKVRYNLDKKVLELQVGEKVYFVAAEQITKLVFTDLNKIFIFNKEKAKLGLLEVISQYENVSLVMAYDIMKLSKNSSTANIYDGEPGGTKTTKYYLLKPNESLFKVSNSKKKNAKFFAEHWTEVEKFIKKDKLSFKEQSDIVKIIDFYAGLSS
jgi:hypothetical protein